MTLWKFAAAVVLLVMASIIPLVMTAPAVAIELVGSVYTGNTAGDVTLEDTALMNLSSGSGFGSVVAMGKRSQSGGNVVFGTSANGGTLYIRNSSIGPVFEQPLTGTISTIAVRSDDKFYVGLEDGSGTVNLYNADGSFSGITAGLLGTGIRAMDVQTNDNVVWGRRLGGSGDVFVRDPNLTHVAVVGNIGEFSTLSVRPADNSIYLGIANDGGTIQRRDANLGWLNLFVQNLGGDFTAMDTLSNGNVVFSNTAGGGSLFIRDEDLNSIFAFTNGMEVADIVATSDGNFYVGYTDGTIELRDGVANPGMLLDSAVGFGTLSELSAATGGSFFVPEPASVVAWALAGLVLLVSCLRNRC